MEERIYNNVGNVLQLNKAGELIQKRMKAVKVCDGLYVTEPDKSGYMQFICELNGVVWLDCKAAENRIADGIKLMPGYFDKIKAGCFDGENIQEFKREISRRINHPDSPAIMELKQPERKKVVPLAENERKVSVYMFKGRTDEITEKRVVIAEVVPHVYTYTYKLKRYGERVKIIFEIDGVYFQGHDTGANVLEREDFTEVCTKAYRLARKNVADGAASGMAYFIEVQKRIDAATPTETPQISTETVETTNVSAEAKQGENEAGMPKYTIYNRDGYTWVVFERGIIRQCAKRSGVSCKCAEWDTIAQAYNGVHSSMGFGNYFFFDSEADAIRFAELVAEGDVCGYWKLYMANLKAEIEAKKQRIAEECAEFDEAQAYFAEIDAGRIAQSLTTPPTPPDEPTIHPADKTPTERTETAEAVNVSAEGEKEAETQEMPRYECPNYADYAFERGWSIENTDFDPHSGVLCMIHFDPSDEKYVCGCLWQINSDKPNYTEHRRFKTLKGAQNYGTKRMGMKLKYQTLTVNCSVTPSEPPQSPTTSTDIQTIKPQENRVQAARKEPKRTIQIFLIVQRPQSVVRNAPRGCFTAVMPHGSPPIRGDCAIINFLTKQSTRYG